MRTVEIGTQEHTRVVCLDESGKVAWHEYEVLDEHNDIMTHINLQDGPVKENGVNGFFIEDLIAIVMDRLEGFQKGELACDENKNALAYLRLSLLCLRQRTVDRKGRGVEGTSEK